MQVAQTTPYQQVPSSFTPAVAIQIGGGSVVIFSSTNTPAAG